MEREQERDEHQIKIDRLESLLRDKDRQDNTVRRQTDEVFVTFVTLLSIDQESVNIVTL